MFDLHPPRSSYKVLFQGTELGEALKRMLLSKAVPEGLKSVECEHGVGGKNSPICYIQEQDPIQEALETKHQPMSFKLSLLSGSEIRTVRWASGIPENLFIHVQWAIHAIKEMELDTKLQEAAKAVKSAILEVELTKMQYKDELKKREKDDSSQQATGANRAASDEAKKSKRQRVTNPLKPRSLQQRQHLTKTERLQRNEWMYSMCRFSNSMEISLLMRFSNPGRKL